VVLRLLQHPELQYLATTALLSLLDIWARSAAVTSAADRAVQAAAQYDITQVCTPQACGCACIGLAEKQLSMYGADWS
jgi:hypothetical protein